MVVESPARQCFQLCLLFYASVGPSEGVGDLEDCFSWFAFVRINLIFNLTAVGLIDSVSFFSPLCCSHASLDSSLDSSKSSSRMDLFSSCKIRFDTQSSSSGSSSNQALEFHFR